MTLIAILSDIHGNGQALDAVIDAAGRHGAEEMWCLGDLVGYGADPAHTMTTCISECSRCLAGNHDLGATGRIPLDVFTAWAYDALSWTAETLGPEGLAQLDQLQPADIDGDVPLFHASPRDPVWEYILSDAQALAALRDTHAPLVMVGHTHVPGAWELNAKGKLRGVAVTEGPIPLEGSRWLVNPGSVGQPRDGDPRASWALLDTEGSTMRVMRTEYDIAGAQKAITDAGLPAGLASRLAEGK